MARRLTRIASLVLCLFVCITESFDIKDLLQRTAGLKRVKRTASCSIDNGGCDIDCEETPMGAMCSCPKGFNPRQDGRSCEDINECETDNGGCNSTCHNNHGSYRCSCPPGYKLNSDERTCRDFDECTLNDSCAHSCTNTLGSYVCHCREGYIEYVVGRCGDINECVENNGGCAHSCINTEGSYQCSCREGYALHWNGKDCIKIEKSSSITDMRQGRIFSASGQRKVWFECNGRHSFQYQAKTPSSFQYLCGDWADRDGVKDAPHPWITRYLPSNYSSTRGIDEFDVLAFNISCAKPSGRKRKKRFWLQVMIKVLVPANRRGKRRFNKLHKSIKRSMKVNHQFHMRFPNVDVVLEKRSSSTNSAHTPSVFDIGGGNYKTCPTGSILNVVTGSCMNCTAGYYQNGIGKLQCIACPSFNGEIRNDIPTEASYPSLHSCAGLCRPGYYSQTGLEPCLPCPENTYQPYYARLACYACGTRNTNSRLASTSFQHCSVRGTCTAGHYYDGIISSCKRCPKGFYQDELGKNFCHQCPTGTDTDTEASTRINDCKSHECVKNLSNIQGYIESPNYPGEYPINTQCKWTIMPPRGRKLLLVIPEIYLRREDRCGDRLSILRKAGGRGSRQSKTVTESESCQTSLIPQTVTPSRSKKLIIEFKSDGRNTAKGFRIPYVTYDESYESIINDIVSDSRLFSVSYHQDILKDKTSRQTLLDVLANPQNYFALRKQNYSGMFRKAFIGFLHDKVVTFLNPSTS